MSICSELAPRPWPIANILGVFNKKYGIIPQTITKKTQNTLQITKKTDTKRKMSDNELDEFIADLKIQMDMAVQNLDFEKAIELRDSIKELTKNRKNKVLK